MSERISFTIDDAQFKKLEEWRSKIRDLFGEVGTEEFIFTPSGIGDSLRVRNLNHKIEIDLTDVSTW